MAPPKNTAKDKAKIDVIRAVTTPLGFYVLALLIVEATLAIVLSTSKLTEEHVWDGFKLMIYVFIGVVIVVTVFAKWLAQESSLRKGRTR